MARKSLSCKGDVTISDPIDKMPQNTGSGTKRVWKHAAILKNLT